MRLPLAVLTAATLTIAACADDGESTGPPSTTAAATTTTETSPATTTTSAPVCAVDDAIDVVDGAIAAARLSETPEWTTDTTTGFDDRTATGDVYATRLGLDCGARVAAVAGENERLALVAWTGPRVAFAIQATDAPTTPYLPEAIVQNPVTEARGEFLADDMSVWATAGPAGESLVLGHVDYNLGAAAKGWAAGPAVAVDDEINLASEQHGLEALRDAGMRNVGIAQSPELGSEEGYVQFVSEAGQISVADVAPTDWFDPMQPRYYTGETSIERVEGVDVRITLPDPDDNLGFIRAAEVAFACDDFVWILEPPFNGTVDEMLASATAVISTPACRAG